MPSKGVDPYSEGSRERRARFDNRGFERGHSSGLMGARFGADHISGAGVAPNLNVSNGIAHIFEAGFGVMLRKKRCFICSLEIELPVAGVDFVEEAEIAG